MSTYRVFEIDSKRKPLPLSRKLYREFGHQREAVWAYRAKLETKPEERTMVQHLVRGGQVQDWWEYDLKGNLKPSSFTPSQPPPSWGLLFVRLKAYNESL